MSWFTRLCRQAGLMVHHVVKPIKSDRQSTRTTVSHKVEEEEVSPKVTLRRTTIEEIELRDE